MCSGFLNCVVDPTQKEQWSVQCTLVLQNSSVELAECMGHFFPLPHHEKWLGTRRSLVFRGITLLEIHGGGQASNSFLVGLCQMHNLLELWPLPNLILYFGLPPPLITLRGDAAPLEISGAC